MKEHTVIAISRQYGSGGRELSNILAKKLGVRLYDRQIVHMAAAQLGIGDMNVEKLKELEETIPPLSLKFMPFYMFGMNSCKPMNHEIYEAEAEIVRRLAKDGSCVILGRCSDHILRNFSEAYSFFIGANDDFRARRGKTVYDGKTLDELNAEDRKRSEYYQYYTGQTWGRLNQYDLAINTSRMELDKAADLIIHYIEMLQSNETEQ